MYFRYMKLKGLVLAVIAYACFGISGTHAAEPVMAEYTTLPLFMSNTATPNILIILDNSVSMNFAAYDDGGDDDPSTGEPFMGEPYNQIGRSFEVRVSSSSGDAEEPMDCTTLPCTAYTNSLDIDIGMDSEESSEMLTGIRFNNVDIGPGDQILDAYIRFNTETVFAGTQENFDLKIYAENTGNADPFQDANGDLSGREATGAEVSWSVPPWNNVDEIHDTPDLKAIVSEIVGRSDWESGNSMAFLFKNSAGAPVSGRMATAWNTDSGKAPQLVVNVGTLAPKRYYGYFNPDFFYVWDSTSFVHKYQKIEYSGDPAGSGYWRVKMKDADGDFTIDYDLYDSEITTGDNTGLWDGNWLNWLCMRRIDVLRKVLMGGLATSRTGGGNSTNIGEAAGHSFTKNFDASGFAAVSPYENSTDFEISDGYIRAPGYDYSVRADKDIGYEPEDFNNYDSGDNLAGILQKLGDKARWGNENFLYGDGANQSGGEITTVVGGNMVSLVNELQNTPCDTWTPLAESYYVAMQYFKQEVPASGLDYKTTGFPIGSVVDPYRVSGTEIPCTKSFVILLTDGASTKDKNIPDFLKDYDGDGRDPGVLDNDGSDYLDDIALYARTNDLRPLMDGDQNLYLYTVYAFSNEDSARQLLKDAARNGGFEDLDGDGVPDGDYGDPASSRMEWDKDGDNIPDTFYEARDGANIEHQLLRAITDILNRAASGTAVSVLSTTGDGEASLVQAYFKPLVSTGTQEAKWVGYLQSLWVDGRGNMREDTNGNLRLDVDVDRIVRYVEKDGNTKIDRFQVSVSDPYPDTSVVSPQETLDLDRISPLWEAGERLAQRTPSTRKIFTFIDRQEDGLVDETIYDYFDQVGDIVSFDSASAGLLAPFLGVASDSDWSHLGDTQGNRALNIISYIRGNDDGFAGSTAGLGIRTRNVDGKVWKLGDIVYSTPTAVSAPSENYDLVYEDSSYYDFYNAMKDRETVIYVGANDGMLHAFTSWKFNSSTRSYEQPASTTENPGDEIWAYIPQALLPHLKWLPDENYTHVPYVDHKPKVFDARILPDDTHYTDADSEENWGTFIIAGLNMGGKHIWARGDYDGDPLTADTVRHFYPSYVCLDVTDPRAPVVMWERSYGVPASSLENSDNSTDQGLSTSYPAVMKVKDRWFAVIGSGPQDYDGTSSGKGHVFVVDLKTGEPEKNLSTGEDWLFETDDVNGFMGSPVTYDRDLTYSVDAVYVGETHGSSGAVYKINVPRECPLPDCSGDEFENYGEHYDDPNSPVNPWIFSKMFDSPAPVTSPAAVSVDDHGNTWVYFGTGRFFESSDKVTTDQQYLFGVKDPFYNPVHNTADTSTRYFHDQNKVLTLYPSDLLNTDSYKVLLNGEVKDGAGTVSFNSFKDTAYSMDGWQRSLVQQPGERSITKPSIIGGLVLYTTYVPDGSICSFGGESYMYALYYETGTASIKAAFEGGTYIDVDGDVVVEDMISLNNGLATTTNIHVGLQVGGKVSSFIQKSTGEILEIKIDPFFKVRSGLKQWEEK